jgi:hypothetical protein
MTWRLSARNCASARENDGQMINPALTAIVQLVRKSAHESQSAPADFCIVQRGRQWNQLMSQRIERDATVVDTADNLCALPCEADDNSVRRRWYSRISMDDAVCHDFGQTQIHVSSSSRRQMMGLAEFCYPTAQALKFLHLGLEDDL